MVNITTTTATKGYYLIFKFKRQKKCSLNEHKDYIFAIFNLAAHGDKYYLNEYLKLSTIGSKYINETDDILKKAPQSELDRLSKLDKFSLPFDSISTWESLSK